MTSQRNTAAAGDSKSGALQIEKGRILALGESSEQKLQLPPYQKDAESYQIQEWEAVFAREFLASDNCGDINGDGMVNADDLNIVGLSKNLKKIADDSKKDSISVLFIFDKLSTYKQEVVHGFHQEIKDKTEETMLVFNQDLDLFEYFINENLGRFDYYIISPHFHLDEASQKRAAKILRRIPNHKLIMIDKWIPEVPGNYGAVYQDFENDAANGLHEGLEKLKKMGKLNVITLPSSLYGPVICKKIATFCKENGIKVNFLSEAPKDIHKGDAFLMLNSQLDSGLIALWENANACGLKVGEDYCIISYNETQIDAIVLNGLTTISTDFAEMGREAARMINDRKMWKTHCPFGMNKRNTF